MRAGQSLSCYASLNHNICVAADPTPVDVDHAAHMARSANRRHSVVIQTWVRGRGDRG